MKKSEIFTFSNFLSFIRIFLVIPIFYFIAELKNDWVIVFIIIAMLTDWFDGYFARKLNQITELGKMLDPLADKVCTTGGFIALSMYQDFPFWVTYVIIGRDLILLAGSLFMIRQMNMITPSNIPGKITVFFITVLALAYLLNIQVLFLPVTYIAVFMILISAFNYIHVFFKNIKAKNEN